MQHDDDGESVSVWMATAEAPDFPPLEGDGEADVCIVGAGIAGISTAYGLAREGLSVAVIDDGSVGGGQTKRTTAHLSSQIDDGFAAVERLHGEEGARLAAESHVAAIDWIESAVREEGIHCDFERVDGYLCLGAGQPSERLDEELEAARRAGLFDVERLPRPPVAGLEGPCLRFPRQAQIHPLRYLEGLAHAAVRRGARIFTGTRAAAIEEKNGAIAVRTARGGTLRARWAVVATNTPIHERVAIHTKQTAFRTYAIALRISPGAMRPALYWDTLDPYHYVRLQRAASDPATELLIVGGEDHRIGPMRRPEAMLRYGRLESWARARFPALHEVAYRWSGEVMEPLDGLAFIGASPGGPERVLLVSGDSGMGMTHGTIAGILLPALIAERPHPWADLYDPARKPLRAAFAFARQNLATAARYGDWLRGGEDPLLTLAPGSGTVLRRGLRRLAVYRSEAGDLEVHSAVCPHLGCVVGWNDAEKTWDCPCHGSRFDRHGRVVHGPANADLAEASHDESRPVSEPTRPAARAPDRR